MSSIGNVVNKVKVFGQKNSPEILLGIGVVGFIGTVVTACIATSKVESVLDDHKIKMSKIEEAKELIASGEMDAEDYTQKDEILDKVKFYTETGVALLKLYGPTIGLGAMSVYCVLSGHKILNGRYVGALTAYNGLLGTFKKYRKNVVDAYGQDVDRAMRYGAEYILEKKKNEKGEKVTEKKENIEMTFPDDDTARYFDAQNPNWDPNPNFDIMFLRGQQNILNDILQTRGHVFLNEVYDALGFEHTPQGAVLGWVKGMGDDYIDFGLYDQSKDPIRRFVNGQDNVVLLEFNHDGVIWDMI